MLQAAIAGLLAGYAIAIPVGAIDVLIIHTGLSHGLRTGIAAAAGAASADLLYASIAALADVVELAPRDVGRRAGVFGIRVVGHRTSSSLTNGSIRARACRNRAACSS